MLMPDIQETSEWTSYMKAQKQITTAEDFEDEGNFWTETELRFDPRWRNGLPNLERG